MSVDFFKNPARKLKFHYNLTRIKDTLYEDLYTFMIMSCSIPLRIRDVSDKCSR